MFFEFIIDRFDNGPFPEELFVKKRYNYPFIFLFNLVISYMSSTNILLKRFLPMYPL